jgi:hypothetical protein
MIACTPDSLLPFVTTMLLFASSFLPTTTPLEPQQFQQPPPKSNSKYTATITYICGFPQNVSLPRPRTCCTVPASSRYVGSTLFNHSELRYMLRISFDLRDFEYILVRYGLTKQETKIQPYFRKLNLQQIGLLLSKEWRR